MVTGLNILYSGTAELARGDNTGAFLASVQAAHPATQHKEEQKSAGDCVPSNSQAHEEKDDASGEGEKKMEH